MISSKEKVVLQDLAKELADCAATDKNKQKIENWTRINDLDTSAKPVFMTHLWEISLKEIFPDSGYKCESEEGRRYEEYLNRKLFFAKHVDDDNVVEPIIHYNAEAHIEDYQGLHVEKRWVGEPGQGAHEFVPVIIEKSDIEKLTDPVLHYDKAATQRNKEQALELFGDQLTVIKRPIYFAAKIVDEFSWLRGMENTYMDMMDDPQWMHECLQRITDNYIKRFKLLEEAGMWGVVEKSDPLGSAGLRFISGMEDWRTADNPTEFAPKLNDSWGFTCAEVCNCVGSEQHDEFSMKYDEQIMNLFKYINVGCCETLDRKIELMKLLPNTRKVSVSEWCDVELAAREIKSDYVYSYRAAGVPFVQNPWDRNTAHDEIKKVLDTTRENNCPLEIVLNIGGTFGEGNARQKLIEWTDMVRSLIDG